MPELRSVWTIYCSPDDFPGQYVVRRHEIICNGFGVPPTITPREQWGRATNTIEEARAMLPPGLERVDRNPEDQPSIAESWL